MTSRYNGRAAASWARAHARDKQPIPDACALFFSLAVWQGGLERTAEWTDEGRRGTIPGTAKATLVHELMDHLIRECFAAQKVIYEWRMGDAGPNAVIPGVKIGDAIVYDYGYGTGFRHIAIVTAVRGGVALVSEWGTADWPGGRCSYVQRRWYYSMRSRMSMHECYPALKVVHLRMK